MARSSLPTSPQTSTSSRPSSGSACGQTLIPPPNSRPLAQITLLATSSSGGSSSTWTLNGTLCQAANVATVAYRNEGVPPSRFDVPSARAAAAPGRKGGEGRVQEGGGPAERFRRSLRACGDGAGQPARADVDVPARALPGGRAERRAAEVDGAGAPAAEELERVLRPLGDAVGADRVAPRAEGQDRQLRARGAARGEAVDDFVDGAVAAERADQLAPVGGGRAGQLDGMPGRLGERGLQLEAELAGARGDARPALAGRPVLRGRIDDH